MAAAVGTAAVPTAGLGLCLAAAAAAAYERSHPDLDQSAGERSTASQCYGGVHPERWAEPQQRNA